MKNRRLLALLLAFCMVFSNLAMGVSATEIPDDSVTNAEEITQSVETGSGEWEFTPIENPGISLHTKDIPECIQELQKAAEVFDDDQTVQAFVVMEEAPLADSASSKEQASAAAENQLIENQNTVIEDIERYVLNDEALDVRYQFTYLTNSFSIETKFGNLEKIANLDGVKSVFIMPVYEAIPTDEVSNPNTVGAAAMTGVDQVWEELGYTGKGMKIAVIDTGLDLDHPSFAAEPETTEDSLTAADINAVLENLNAYARMDTITGETLYRSAKIPYAFNYVDNNLTADHSADTAGDHGSHVAGIAAANVVEGAKVKGMAPDAQIIVMKVFGAAGGAYTDDIVAALEDAMTLGCDVVNASLGSAAGFTSTNTEIDLIYERLAQQDIIACISAGNEGNSAQNNMWGTDMNRTSNPDNATVGQPGVFENVMTVASADNAVIMSSYMALADGTKVFYQDSIEAQYKTEGFPGYESAVCMSELAGQELKYVIVPGLGAEEDFAGLDVAGKIAIIKRGELNFSTKIVNAQNAGAVGVIIWNTNDTDDLFSFGMTTEIEEGVYPGIPSCIIYMRDGQFMADANTKTVTVSAEPGERVDANGGQISSFSSWGVAPDLSLEPDITGVGGSVYSCYDGGGYGVMSGTSMSSPQVAGVTALVMQRLYELYPNAAPATVRNMAEALLMSTANPISATYTTTSPRQQGAGLVDAYQAVTSTSYLTVGGEKPKAELGDGTSGTYTFSFEVHNFGNKKITYVPSGIVTTELAASGYGEYWMYGENMPLEGKVTFNKSKYTVPSGGTTTVKATVTLTEEDKAYFAESWPNGGFLEGFVYMYAVDKEGAVTSQLSLPYLGFYGDWTQAPVFDTAYWYDNSAWGLPYANGLPEGDEYYHIMWTDLGGSDYMLGLNPYSGPVADANGNIIYDPAHNVVSPNGDGYLDGISDIYLSLLRNAKYLTMTWTVNGEVMCEETFVNNPKTMYQSNYGQVVPWIYSWYGYGPYDFTDAEGNVLPSGTEVLLTIDGYVDYGNGGNHTIQIPITVDNEPGWIEAVGSGQLPDGTDVLIVGAADNVAVASVILLTPYGQICGQVDDVQMADGLAYFDISDLGTQFIAVVCDYAANESYYRLTYTNSPDDNLPEHEHTVTEYTSNDDATCTEDGTKTGFCDVCDQEVTVADEGSALGHDVAEYVSNNDATCTEDGTKTGECSRCGKTDTVTDEGTALGHSFGEYVSNDDATCTEDGTKTRTCGLCGETETVIDEGTALGHSFGEYVSNGDATCTEDGTKTRTCALCGEIETVADEGSALGHNYVDGVCANCGIHQCNVARLTGASAFETSIIVAEQMLAEMGADAFNSVILVPANAKNAQPVGYLAASKNAPVLMYDANDALNLVNYLALRLAKNGTVYILGDVNEIPVSMNTELAAAGFNAKRIAGKSIIETNMAVLTEAGMDNAKELLVCSGNKYANAMAADSTGLPILLVGNKLTKEQKTFLKGFDGQITIIGDKSAVGDKVVKELGAKTRISGSDISVKIAERYYQNADLVLVACANDCTEILCSSAMAACLKVPMVLASDSNYAAADAYVEGASAGYILGSTGCISDAAARDIFELIADAEIPMA